MDSGNELIFVSIACYRDTQLVPTVQDLLLKAQEPSSLRFGICWQHDAEDPPLPFLDDPQFQVIDVPWQRSRGACWARAEIMKLWRGEQYFLQVDAHCRFAPHWDTKLIRMMAQTGSARPLLSTYAFPFAPLPAEDRHREDLSGTPQLIAIETFTGEGLPQLKPLPIRDVAQLVAPVPARFLAAGFFFTLGRFVEEVPYDPELYFFGEEISMTLRAFTSGYDLFHPQEHIAWHDYERRYAIRHWDDHAEPESEAEAGPRPLFGELDRASRIKVTRMLQASHEGAEPFQPDRFGLGAARSLSDYEEYAGLSFSLRKIQDYTRRALAPPNPPAPEDWPSRIYTWLVRIVIEAGALPQNAFNTGFWVVALQDAELREIHRRDCSKDITGGLTDAAVPNVLVTEMQGGLIPVYWSIWPYHREQGWLSRISGTLGPDDFTIVTD